jgi:biotin transport system ATP-binding protein
MIEIEGVTHRYGDREVLHDLTITLTEQRIGVIGANGSGKSTFARLLNGLVLPSAGRVRVAGNDTRREGAAVRRQVGFVFTDPDAQIVMPTVAEDVAFSLRRHRLSGPEREQRVHRALDRFALSDYADQPAHLLSGGQKQLLALAAVLVTEPRVLVCDEPTTLLDLRNSRRVSQLLEDLPQQVVMVTHHLDLLEGYDRVLVIDAGRLVHDGTPDSAVTFYRDLVAERPANGVTP